MQAMRKAGGGKLPGEPVSVEINQCVGCTRQHKSFSARGRLARSSGEEPASPRHRARRADALTHAAW